MTLPPDLTTAARAVIEAETRATNPEDIPIMQQASRDFVIAYLLKMSASLDDSTTTLFRSLAGAAQFLEQQRGPRLSATQFLLMLIGIDASEHNAGEEFDSLMRRFADLRGKAEALN